MYDKCIICDWKGSVVLMFCRVGKAAAHTSGHGALILAGIVGAIGVASIVWACVASTRHKLFLCDCGDWDDMDCDDFEDDVEDEE